ncbi:MAG: DUF928 domain-containing protein [Cyanobacteria bacterium P01_H01_bin.121]
MAARVLGFVPLVWASVAIAAPAPGSQQLAQTISEATQTNETSQIATTARTKDFSDRGRPAGRSRGGGDRGCVAHNQAKLPPLTALVPSSEQITEAGDSNFNSPETWEQVLTFTASEHPSFWFYVPYELDSPAPLEFVLQDDAGSTLYQVEMSSADLERGIVQITLPETAPALEIDRQYEWFFLAHCDPNQPPTYVSGWTERRQPPTELMTQLTAIDALQDAKLYAQSGLWQDAITVLGEAYRSEPQDVMLKAEWLSFLESEGFSDLIDARLTNCCVPQPGQVLN